MIGLRVGGLAELRSASLDIPCTMLVLIAKGPQTFQCIAADGTAADGTDGRS